MNNDTPADAMKPCDFCKAEWPALKNHGGAIFGFAVHCLDCGSRGPRKETYAEAHAAWNTRTPSLAAQDGLVDALRYARSQIVGLAVSGTDRIDELCRKLQKLDPSPIWPIPFPDPPERTWQPIVKKIDAALASIEVKS